MLKLISTLIQMFVLSITNSQVYQPMTSDNLLILGVSEHDSGVAQLAITMKFDDDKIIVDEWLDACEYYDVPCLPDGQLSSELEAFARLVPEILTEIKLHNLSILDMPSSLSNVRLTLFEDGSGQVQDDSIVIGTYCLADTYDTDWYCNDPLPSMKVYFMPVIVR